VSGVLLNKVIALFTQRGALDQVSAIVICNYGIAFVKLSFVFVILDMVYWQLLDFLREKHSIVAKVIDTASSVLPVLVMTGDDQARWLRVAASGKLFEDFGPEWQSGEDVFPGWLHAADSWDVQQVALNVLGECIGKMDVALRCLDLAKLDEHRKNWNRLAVTTGRLFKAAFGTITPKIAMAMHIMPRDWYDCAKLGILPNFVSEAACEKVRRPALHKL
jgi:hypothetical protein